MKSSFWRCGSIIVLLSVVSIPLHEFGHYIVYRFANVPVHITFQSVRPVSPISGPVALLGLAGGPAFSLIAGLACLFIADHRQGFFWATAAFTNASLRLFPCTMDLLHSIQGRMPFSDEGEIAIALTHSLFARFLVVLLFFAVGCYYHRTGGAPISVSETPDVESGRSLFAQSGCRDLRPDTR